MIDPKRSDEIVRGLAAVERSMDRGEVKYVRLAGSPSRLPLSDKMMERFGLEHGQTISITIYDCIVMAIAEEVKGEVATSLAAEAIEKAMKAAKGGEGEGS